jgi:hypothetical protein
MNKAMYKTNKPGQTWAVRLLLTSIALISFSSILQAAPKADLWPYWDVHDARSQVNVDHSAWQAFLDQFVQANADGVNRVAYQRAMRGDGRVRLNAYIASLSAIDPRRLNSTEQLAYWINLYNALTVEVVMRYPRKRSITKMGERWFSVGPWDDELAQIAGQPVTLNDIEHRILRPIWRDHRIHYAVNCASLGCPNLSKTAYRHDNVDGLLAVGEHSYINHPRGVAFADKGLRLSEIYDWYGDDFATDEQALLTYLADQHDSLGERLRQYRGRIQYAYDWQLNSVEAR